MKIDRAEKDHLIKELAVLQYAHCEVELADIKVRQALVEYDNPFGPNEATDNLNAQARDHQFMMHYKFRKNAEDFLDDWYDVLIELLSDVDKEGGD